MKTIRNVKSNRLIPLIAAAALVAVMAASALTMTQQAYANPCSITKNGDDTTVSDEGVQGPDSDGNINCTFEDDVITFGPDAADEAGAAGATEQAGIQGSGAGLITLPIG
jgi:hypothetical protein